MPATTGNAVNAKWVGPDGMQLWDGTILHTGDVVLDIGYDEANGSDYWEIVPSVGGATVAPTSASELRDDWSFGVEEGGGSTGRPELSGGAAEVQQASVTLSPTSTPASSVTSSDPDTEKADS